MPDNKQVIRDMEDALNRRDWVAYAARFADPVRWRKFPADRQVTRAAYLDIIQDIARTFPDWFVTIERLVAEDDWVAELARVSGSHRAQPRTPHHGDLRGVEPTDKKIEVWQAHFWRLRDGIIVEHEPVRDDLGIFRQLGLVSTHLRQT